MAVAGLAVAAVLAAYGMYQSGQEKKRQAEAQAREREFEAVQLEQIAGNEIGAGQRAASEERRKARIIQSRALALAAASGGGAADPTVADVISDIEAEGSYNAAVALYQGEERARQARMGAAGRRFEAGNSRVAGSAAAGAAGIQAAGSLFSSYYGGGGSGMSTLFSKYSGGGGSSTRTLDTGTPGLGNYS